MLSLKATVLLGAPLLAAASDILPSRIQRRAALLELLEHQHDRRQNEAYGSNPPPICNPDAGTNDASYTELDAGQTFPDAVYSYTYEAKDQKDKDCLTAGNCQTACIADASVCFGYTFAAGATPVCTLYGGSAYGGNVITTVPSGFMFLENAGSTGEGGETVATCATKGVGLDAAADNGACDCGPGRYLGSSAFVCEANAVPAGAVSEPKSLEKPVTFSVPVSWSNSIQGVPAVMTPTQCAAICLADKLCQAYLLKSDSELNSCWKLGSGGVYASPQKDAPTASGSSAMTKRQAAGTQLGGPGFTFGQTPDSTLVNDADAPAPSQRARMMRTKRGHNHSQW